MADREEEKINHSVEYEMTINFKRDGVSVKFSGESVIFSNSGDEHPIRPRHLRIVNIIHSSMREFILNNK